MTNSSETVALPAMSSADLARQILHRLFRDFDGNIHGGFKNQAQQLMFSSGFSKFHIKQEFVVNRYGGSKTE